MIENMRSRLTKLPHTTIHTCEAHPRVNSAVTAVGRVLYSLIFISAGLNHFTAKSIAHAATLGVPFAAVATPLSGVLAFAGGLSILLGYRAKLGAWLIVLFLIPVTLGVHRFWGIADPVMAETQLIMFMKNVSIIGGALIISQFGAGTLSLDARLATKKARIPSTANVMFRDYAETRSGTDVMPYDSEPSRTQSTGRLK